MSTINREIREDHLQRFLMDSNEIEGIHAEPTRDDRLALLAFLKTDVPSVADLCLVQMQFAPGKPLRQYPSMNVRVAQHIAPAGGPEIALRLITLLERAVAGDDPWAVHVAFEMLHPFMDGNGRTGRALWLWQMVRQQPARAFSLPFLHRFYYQTLSGVVVSPTQEEK